MKRLGAWGAFLREWLPRFFLVFPEPLAGGEPPLADSATTDAAGFSGDDGNEGGPPRSDRSAAAAAAAATTLASGNDFSGDDLFGDVERKRRRVVESRS